MTEVQSVTINVKKLAVIVPLVLTLLGASWTGYKGLTGYLDTLATKVEVQQSEINSSIELVTVTMMGYEDELMGYEFLVETDQATPADRVARTNVIRRITDLKTKLNNLESRSIELQDKQTGSQVGSKIE